jgi:hypothetical protein
MVHDARIVRIGGKHLPKHSRRWRGDSIGHWEGDTLVVDTTHLAESTLMGNGLRHSAQAHLIERFRTTPDGAFLHWTQVVEDPVVLGNRGVRYNVFERRDGYVYPYDCDPAYGLSIQERGGQESP